jgi:hypothetical protein
MKSMKTQIWMGLLAGALAAACGKAGASDDTGPGGADAGPGRGGSDDDMAAGPGPNAPGNADDDATGPAGDDDTAPPDTPSDDDVAGDDDATSPDLGNDSGPGALPEGTDPGGVDLSCDSSDPGIDPLMKLSTVQYRNTVRDLLVQAGMGDLAGVADDALSSVPDDSLGDSFRSADARISLEHVQGYLDVGRAVGDALVAKPTALESAVGACASEAQLSESCATDFLTRFLGLVYRRPVSSDDLVPYLELNDGTRSPSDAIRAMVVVALSSPRFVNHVEIDGTASSTNPDLLQLSSYEIASRLSYTFWQTMPDQELFAAAEDGSLGTEAGFNEQLDRVFSDPRTKDTLWQFWNEWLKLEKFTGFETTRPAFQALTADTAIALDGHDYWGDMVSEMRTLTEVLTFDQTSTIADVLTTNLSVTESPDLAALYGVEPYSGNGPYPTLPEGTRAGLFQRAAVLASNLEQTNPFHRGALVRRALLCDSLPQPSPNDLPPGSLDPPPFDPAQTTRERFQAKVEGNGLCETCHGTFSDIGYVLESFDSLGRYRTTETVYDQQNGDVLAELPIDTTGVARIDPDDTTVVDGPIDLAQRMVESQRVETCLAQNYFLYSLRRDVQVDSGDACEVSDLAALLRDPDQGLAAAFKRIAQYDGFFQRKVGPR